MSMTYECDMEEEVFVSTPHKEEGLSDKLMHFKGTVKHLDALARCLICTKCNKLPKDKVWTLGCCLAKYCNYCADKVSGSSCQSCGKTGYPKDKQPDLFSSSILSEIPAVYMTIMRLEELGFDKKNAEDVDEGVVEVDKQEVDEELDSTDVKKKNGKQRETVNSKVIVKTTDPYEFEDMDQEEVHGTPQDQVMISQDFPEVLEETPEHKIASRVRASLTSRKSENKLKKAAARSLKLPSQKKETTVEKELKIPTPPPPESPEKNDQFAEEQFQTSPVPSPPESPQKKDESDLFLEELFQTSPVPPPAPVNDKTSPAELPILTPYGKTSDTSKQKIINDTPLKGEDEELGKPRSRSSRITRGSNRFRSPGEEEPPALTPHKKGITKDDDDEDFKNSAKKRITRSRKSSVSSTDSRKSARGRGGRKVKVESKEPTKASKASLLLAKAKSPEYNPKVVVEDICKRSSSSDRKRRVSSTSVASVSSSVSVTTPVSKEKRVNSKGETQLHVACRAGQLKKVKALMESGVDVNAEDNAGWTAIHEVINGKGAPEDKADILRIICERGANVNAFGGQNEETPLHFAVQMGGESLVEILLEFGASPNIRCKNGQLPKDLAFNDVILKLLEEKMGISTTSPNQSINLNNSTLSEDHALMQTMLKKAVVFFNYDVGEDIRSATKKKLGLKVADKLGPDVTHVIHKLSGKKEKSSSCVHISLQFLYAMANCMWQVSSGWIDESLKNGSCVVPCSYEILGCLDNKRNDTDEAVPGIARLNRETGNPGLLDGFCFYLYKTCGYTSGSLKLNKKNLTELISTAGGNVSNREPNPDTVDPCEAPPRFHVLNNVRGSDDSSGYDVEKLTLTTHIYLYEDGSPPPVAKLYNMEHVKSLKSTWLIDSLAQFRLLDPSNYL